MLTAAGDETTYLQEVVPCLVKILARLLELRPNDPIEFLSSSLREHRRLNPEELQGKQLDKNKKTSFVTKVVSPTTTNSQSRTDSSDETNELFVNQPIFTDHEDYNEVVKDFIDKQLFVHEEFTPDNGAIGDLFDDGDFR